MHLECSFGLFVYRLWSEEAPANVSIFCAHPPGSVTKRDKSHRAQELSTSPWPVFLCSPRSTILQWSSSCRGHQMWQGARSSRTQHTSRTCSFRNLFVAAVCDYVDSDGIPDDVSVLFWRQPPQATSCHSLHRDTEDTFGRH